MMSNNDKDRAVIRTALESLKPLESFTIEGHGKTILVACLELGAYAISCWCKESELAIKIQDILQARGINAYQGGKNQKERLCVVGVVSSTIDGEQIVLKIATALGLSAKPNPARALITTSRIELE